MTPQERQMLGDLFERISSTNSGPRDPQAEAFINDAVRAMPYAPYMLAQTVLVQQHALEAAAERIKELEAQAKPRSRAAGNEFSRRARPHPVRRRLVAASAAPRAPSSYDASAYQRGAAGRRRRRSLRAAAAAYAPNAPRRRPGRGARPPSGGGGSFPTRCTPLRASPAAW